jgi:modulator of FtsH protease
MAYRFQPQGQYRGTAAPAMPAQSMLAQVLGITAVGLCITGTAAYFLPGVGFGMAALAMIAGFILLFVINATRANEGLSLVLFYVFALLEGVGIAPVIGHYLRIGASDVVFNAAITTGLGMFALAAVVYATGLDLRRFQGIFMLALLGLIVVGIASAFLHFLHPGVYAWITLVIFAGLVLIDFARLRAGGDGLTPVQMSVSIYLDAINIFLALLQIFGGRRSND